MEKRQIERKGVRKQLERKRIKNDGVKGKRKEGQGG